MDKIFFYCYHLRIDTFRFPLSFSSLLRSSSLLTLLITRLMQHDFSRILRRIEREPLTPIVTDRIREDAAVLVKCGGGNRAANGWVALESRMGVLVPEVKRPVRAGGAEGTVDGVEGDGIDRVDFAAVVGWWFAVAFK